MINLNLVSYNCNSVGKNVDLIRLLMRNCDIIFLQEIILLDDDLSFLRQISGEFNYIASPSKSANSASFEGRFSGGNAKLYRISLNADICLKFWCEHYLIAEMIVHKCRLLLVNAYMPYDDRSNGIGGVLQ